MLVGSQLRVSQNALKDKITTPMAKNPDIINQDATDQNIPKRQRIS